MISYEQMNKEELAKEINYLEERFQHYKALNYNLNMSRGKPCKEQLDLSNGMTDCLGENEYKTQAGFDCRNYGIPDGIPEAKILFASILGTNPENVIVGGNSSLNLMYDTISRAMIFGVPGSLKPWGKEEKISFICPVPGYDRHFSVTKEFGIGMIPVPMNDEGPDMDMVESLVSGDASIKGMWCVPLYSNPDGITYSEKTCKRLASMKTAASDFRIIWDNSYCVHTFGEGETDYLPEILSLCESYGNENRIFEFASTSKITWAGSGIACTAASKENVAYIKAHLSMQTIGPDKMNQLRHVRFLKDINGVYEIMKKHAEILRPKFEAVLAILDKELGGTGIARWNEPKGGYFVSLFVSTGTAREVVDLCKSCGVELTPAGATYPNGIDPMDSNIRIAPSFPPVNELIPAIEILCVSTKIAAAKKAMAFK
ncbi:MAG: aminotransferase class I/II-fold pyridoxal phosphate-dependent enzyme [Saccharofermentanales bacterium]